MRIIVVVNLLAVLFLTGCAASQKIITDLNPEEKIGMIEKRDKTTVQEISEEEALLFSKKLFVQKYNLLQGTQTIYCRHEEWGKGYYSSYLEFEFQPPQELEDKAEYILLTLRNASPGKRMFITIKAVTGEDAFRLPATPKWMQWGRKQILGFEAETRKEWEKKFVVLSLSACTTSQKPVVKQALVAEHEVGVVKDSDGNILEIIPPEETQRLSEKFFAEKNILFEHIKKSYTRRSNLARIGLQLHQPQGFEGKPESIKVNIWRAADDPTIYMDIWHINYKDTGMFLLLPVTPSWMNWAQKQIPDFEAEVAKEWSFKKKK